MIIKALLDTSRRLRRPSADSAPSVTHRWLSMSPQELRKPQPLLMTPKVVASIRQTVGTRPAESGGALVGPGPNGVISHFHFDTNARTTGATYSPDVDTINALARTTWKAQGQTLLGFVHSHPRGATRPSGGDLSYAERILSVRPRLDRFALPIAQTVPDTGAFSLYGAVAVRDGHRVRIEQTPISVVPDSSGLRSPDDGAWDRVRTAYDLGAMSRTRIVVVGCGGSAAFIEDMARCGIGEIVLIDPDVVDRPNIGTQQVYRSDLGRPKVDALAERILDVSRHVRVLSVQALLDELDDTTMTRLLTSPLPHGRIGQPALTVLCGFTDNFWAQARVNRLALTNGVPQLHAGVYTEGRGIELFFSVPDHSQACARCVLHSRYDQYLNHGFQNDVTSHGTPLLATNRLNELKSIVMLSMIHGTSPAADLAQPATGRWSSVLDYVAPRNFVQVGLEPLHDPVLGLRVFRSVAELDPRGRLGMDQTIWHDKTARGDCPDCGGSGDLTKAIGSIPNTTLHPRTNRKAS